MREEQIHLGRKRWYDNYAFIFQMAVNWYPNSKQLNGDFVLFP